MYIIYYWKKIKKKYPDESGLDSADIIIIQKIYEQTLSIIKHSLYNQSLSFYLLTSSFLAFSFCHS